MTEGYASLGERFSAILKEIWEPVCGLIIAGAPAPAIINPLGTNEECLMKRINKRRICAAQLGIFLGFASFTASQAAAPTEAGKEADDSALPAQDIVRKIKGAARNSPEQRKLIQALRRRKIDSASELDALVGMAKDAEIGNAALAAVGNIDSTAKPEVKNKAVDLIDVQDDSDDLRVVKAILRANVKNKFPGAVDRIRGRMNREPKTRLRSQEDLAAGMADRTKIRKVVMIQELARALAESGDRQSLEQIFSLDEVLSVPSAPSIVGAFGKDALVYAAARYPQEEGLRKRSCLAIISASKSADSIPELKKLMKSSDAVIRINALKALVRNNADGVEAILESSKGDADERVRDFAKNEQMRSNPTAHLKDLEEALFGSDSTKQLHALEIISKNPPKGSEAILEKFIKDDEAANPRRPHLRAYAAEGLWRLSGRKTEYSRGAFTMTPYPWDDPTRK